MTNVIKNGNIDSAAKCLKNGGTVVFPTETVYGLGADAFNPDAVLKIFAAKNRPADNPLIVHVCKKDDIYSLSSDVTDNAKKIIDNFWPGPITIIVKRNKDVIDQVTAGLDTVAVRMPSNKTAAELIEKSGVFVAAPSANLSGSPSPTVFEHVFDDMNGRVDYIIDGGFCEIGLESTVVDVSSDKPCILRPGAVTYEQLKAIIPEIEIDSGITKQTDKPKSPGMKYTHYSPKAQVIVVQGEKQKVREYISQKLCQKGNLKIGVLSYKGGNYKDADMVIDAGQRMKDYAKELFYSLRQFDYENIDIIYAEFQEDSGIGYAVKNRLYKSAGYNVIKL